MKKSLLATNGLLKLFSFLFAVTLSVIAVKTEAQTCTNFSYDLDQGKNGSSVSPLNPVEWTNQNLNSNASHYVEGHVVPYRAILSGLDSGLCYCVVIEWDIRHSGVNALDYITSYPNCTNTLGDDPSHQGSFLHDAECVDPLDGVGLVNPTINYFQIPAPTNNALALGNLQPVTSFNGQEEGETNLTMFNGLITSANYVTQGSLVVAQSATSLQLCFTAQGDEAVLAWGGHIASRLEWGVGNSAGSISGSPYHMRVIGMKCCHQTSFTGGNQDRSLQAGAVTPAPIAYVVSTDTLCVGGTNTHLVTTNEPGASTYSWTITNAGTTGALILGSDTTQQIQVSTASAGEYIICGTVTINGVSDSDCDTITVLAAPVCSISGDTIVCNGASATFTASGGGSYLWSTGETTASINVSESATYTVTITGAGGCTSSCSRALTASSPFSLDFDVTDVFCFGNSTGAINLNILGSGTGLEYVWSNGALTQDISGLAAGTYTVTVSDENGCSLSGSAEVNQPDAALQVIESHINASCNNGTDGSIDLTISGGTAPYTIEWSNNSLDEDITGLGAGNYSVLVTDFSGCTAGLNVEITEPSQITIDDTQVNVACNGGNDGSIDITVSGGTPGYGYLWEDNSTSEDRTGLSAGTYTVTVTDDNGCTATESYVISQAGSLVLDETHDDVTCFDGNDGAIDVTISGGTPSYGYLWSDGSVADDRIGLAAGTYTLTVTDANGCSVVETIVISEPDLLVISEQHEDANCFGDANGSINLTINGGTPGYLYLWNTGSTDEDLSALTTGTYTVTVTDENGCTATESIFIDQPTELLITDSDVTDVSCFEGTNGAISITVSGGTPDYIYSWSNGADTEDISGLTAGDYNVNITDAHGCSAYMEFTIEEPLLLEVSETNVDLTCFESGNGSIDLSVSGGTTDYTYNWSNGASTEDISSLSAGVYTVTVTDNNGCTASLSAEITQPLLLELLENHSNETCNENNDGSINLGVMGGTPEYNYNWSNGETIQDITGLAAGTYTVTVTDNNSCSETLSVSITQPDALEVTETLTNSICGGASGAIDITATGGTSPYSYNWSNGETTEDISGLAAGSYTVTVTDENECSVTETYNITDAGSVQANAVGTDATCNGGSTGSADLTVSGGTEPYGFEWSNGATTEDVSGLAAGTYTVTITDANGCIGSAQVTIGEPTAIDVTVDNTPVSCNEGADGSLDITVTGGTSGYTFLWNTGETTEDISGLAAGTYTVTVTDNNQCTATASYEVTEPTALSLGTTQVDVLCNGFATGSIDLTVSGGTPGYTFNWSNGAITEDISGLTAGTYTVTVTDENGCSDETSATITEPFALVIDETVTNSTCGGASGSIDITVSGGNDAYSYNWSNGETTEDISGLAAGTYTVTVTDENQCSVTETYNITDAGAVQANAIGTDVTCNGGSDGSADLTVSGGTSPYGFVWSNGAVTEDISGLAAGTYTVTVTDENGCIGTAQVTIGEPDAIVIVSEGVCSPCKKAGEAYASASATGGTGTLTYLWSTGETTQVINNLASGTYTVTVTDASGCTATDEVTLECDPECQYKTFTMGGWGAVPNGNNPGVYLHANFANAYPNGLHIGCDNTLILTSAQDITNFLPSGSTASQLPAGSLVNPGGSYNNVLAGQLVAASLNVGFDSFDAGFSAESGNLADLIIASGDFAGWSLAQLLDSANAFIGGCGSQYSASQFNDALSALNENFDNGTVNEGFVLCPAEELTAYTVGTDVSCDKVCDGTAEVFASEGTAPYTYLWSTGATTAAVTDLCEGTYTVTVTDENGCEVVVTVDIGKKSAQFDFNFVVTNSSCNGSGNGMIDLTVTGGTAPYTYVWSNGETTEDIANLDATTYTVTVTDANGCTDSDVTIVEEPSLLTAVVVGTDITCEKDDNGTANLTASGGTGPYTYLWSNGETTEDISGLVPGTYTVTVTDANDCTASSSVVIGILSSWIYISYDNTHATCNGGNDGAIDASFTGGVGPFTFLWSNGATTEDISGLSPGFYTLTITDANGCSNSKTTYINNPARMVATVTKVKPVCGLNGSINLTVTGGVAPLTYLWSNGATTEDISGLVPGYYTVTVTDNNGCSIIYTTRMWGAAEMKLKLVSLTHTSDCICDGAIDIKVKGGTAPFNYLWSNGAITQDISNLCAGAYKVTVTDAKGCVKKKTWRILYAKDVVPVRLAETQEVGSRDISLMSVYPSPAVESATVRVVFDNPGKADIKIINILGKVELHESNLTVDEGVIMDVRLDVNSLSSGTYMVAVTQNGETVYEKIQIVK